MARSASRSRSRSPRSDREGSSSRQSKRRRSRSRSPRRSKGHGGGGGFRWKDKGSKDKGRDSRRDRRDDYDSDNRRGLERGYRRDRDGQGPRRDRERDEGRNAGNNADDVHTKEPRRARDDGGGVNIDSKFGKSSVNNDNPKLEKDKPKEKRVKVAAASSEPMIIVNINDRLGTKASIPCLASDPVKLFKAQVAARIGRAPHEIMLKRQGERPFKDNLTLEDYGVSNGVQLDLELDTGD